MRYIVGSAFHTPCYGELEYLPDAILRLDDRGLIESVTVASDPRYEALRSESGDDPDTVVVPQGSYLLPGFVDLHVHAPQWPQAGLALDAPLEQWLGECTFPLEARYADTSFAREVYTDLVRALLARGTTTSLYFATVHREASVELARVCAELGQRGLVGKVVMDLPEMNPEYYRDADTATALAETEAFIQQVRAISCPQGVFPVVTPRFAPSCSAEALAGLGELAHRYDTHVQSHCSESDWAHDHIIERFGAHDAAVLDQAGLLGPKSVMAHCTFLDDADLALFAARGTAIAHCPISNAYFANSVLATQRFSAAGVTIGLGTDISGGFSPSLYDNIRQAVIASRVLDDGVDATMPAEDRGVRGARITVVEALYLATTAGGLALDLPIGILAPGYAADFQIVSTTTPANPLRDFGVFPNPEHQLEKLLYLATPANIEAVYVQGRRVTGMQ